MVGDWPERDIKGAGTLGMITVFARYGDTKGTKDSGAEPRHRRRLRAGGHRGSIERREMRVLTAAQMQEVDAETIARVCPGLELMERAGRGVAKAVLARHGTTGDGKGGKAAIFVGPGNNGGDGLVVARLLIEAGWRCSIHLLKAAAELTPDAAKNHQRLHALKARAGSHTEFDSTRPDWPERAREDLADASVVIDAIFGTGSTGAPRGRAAEMIASDEACAASRRLRSTFPPASMRPPATWREKQCARRLPSPSVCPRPGSCFIPAARTPESCRSSTSGFPRRS